MKRTILLFACIPALCSVNLQAQNASNSLTDAEKAYVLSKFCTEVKYNFVFYNDLAFDWDSLCLATLPTLLAAKSRDEYVRELQRLCTRLHDGHTSVYEDNPGDNKDWIKPLPIQTKRVGGRVFVTKVLSSAFQKQGVETGSEIMEIDGLDVVEYVNRYKRPYTSSSTPQWLDYSPYSGFALTKEKGSNVSKVLFRNRDGKTFTVESHRNISWDINANGANTIFEYRVAKGNVGLLKINTFMGNDLKKEFDTLYRDIRKTDALIIDLRNNTGGNSGYADYIARHLSATPVKTGRWSSRMYVAAHGSWGYPQEWYMQTPDDLMPVNKDDIYTKPVMLLVNAGTFSSAENFCVAFRSIKKGKIIGTPTGGSTGNPIRIELGFGIFAQICTKNEWDAEGRKFIGVGIIPDIEVEESADDFLKGRDALVDEALKQIEVCKK